MGFISWLFGKKKEQYAQEIESLKKRFVQWEESLQEEFDALREDVKEILKPKDAQPELNKDLFKKVILVNNTLTVMLTDGSVYTCAEANAELFHKVIKCTNSKEVFSLLFPDQKSDMGNREDLTETKNILLESGEFERLGEGIAMKGIPLTIPNLLLGKFKELIQKVENELLKPKGDNAVAKLEAEYKALQNFWKWCVANPNPQAREDLFKFLKNHDLQINKHGFFFTYRRVVTADVVDAEYQAFISEQYVKIKGRWKKNPNHYFVTKDENGEYFVSTAVDPHKSYLGTLGELYSKMKNAETKKTFTDSHSQTFKIQIGVEVSMPRSECDGDNQRDCSYGLHSGNKSFGFDGFGDTQILCLINPMNVVSVPNYDSNKMRSCAYLPVSVITNPEEQTTLLESIEVLDLADEYFVDQVEQLDLLLEENMSTLNLESNVWIDTADDWSIQGYSVLSSLMEMANNTVTKRTVMV